MKQDFGILRTKKKEDLSDPKKEVTSYLSTVMMKGCISVEHSHMVL